MSAAHANATAASSFAEPLPPPEVPRRLRIGMPQLDAGGLSEAWLLRHAGDLHWEAIARQLGVASDEIRCAKRQRLYATVVALRARYDRPLAAARENDVFDAAIETVPCGGVYAHGHLAGYAGPIQLSLELLSAFARREPGGAMRTAMPAARHASCWAPIGARPNLVALARAVRRADPVDDPFCGPLLAPRPDAPIASLVYEPSPYGEYNGAGLLYFAAYAAIADTAERRIVHQLGLAPAEAAGADWARAASPVARDVFFYGNLPLGDSLHVDLMSFAPAAAAAWASAVDTRVRLRRGSDGAPIGDVLTRRQLLPRVAPFHG